jgi:hypothetical protein
VVSDLFSNLSRLGHSPLALLLSLEVRVGATFQKRRLCRARHKPRFSEIVSTIAPRRWLRQWRRFPRPRAPPVRDTNGTRDPENAVSSDENRDFATVSEAEAAQVRFLRGTPALKRRLFMRFVLVGDVAVPFVRVPRRALGERDTGPELEKWGASVGERESAAHLGNKIVLSSDHAAGDQTRRVPGRDRELLRRRLHVLPVELHPVGCSAVPRPLDLFGPIAALFQFVPEPSRNSRVSGPLEMEWFSQTPSPIRSSGYGDCDGNPGRFRAKQDSGRLERYSRGLPRRLRTRAVRTASGP